MKTFFASLAVISMAFIAGCGNPTPQEVQQSQQQAVEVEPSYQTAGDPLALSSSEYVRASEINMVEQMVSYRNSYMEELKKLGKFYDRQGNQLKAVWVKKELDALAKVEMRPYIVMAEVAGPDLSASESIAEADAIFGEAKEQIINSRGVFRNMKGLLEAKEKMENLILQYPTSDKIDDAAWEIAEIYNRDLVDYYVAMFYYQRVWQWDPANPYSARFAVAKIYDEFFHNYLRACEFYEKAIQLEPAYTANVTYAKNRIKAINSKN